MTSPPQNLAGSRQIAELKTITSSQLETRLGDLESRVQNPIHGLFGPQSMAWYVNRESIAFLGAGRALLLQLAHPCIAQSIEDHSPVKREPWGRYYRTMPPVFAMVFGSLDQAFEQARAIYRIHERIHGVLPEAVGALPPGTAYNATDAHATLWVHATLWHTSLLCSELALGQLAVPERDKYYEESERFAALFGIPRCRVPRSAQAFEAYMEDMISGDLLEVGSAGRSIADYFFGTAHHSFGRFLPAWYRAVTARLLPEQLREPFQMPYGVREQELAERTFAWISRIYPRLPGRLRFVGPFQEAMERVAGRSNLGLWTRAMNTLWLGRSRLAP